LFLGKLVTNVAGLEFTANFDQPVSKSYHNYIPEAGAIGLGRSCKIFFFGKEATGVILLFPFHKDESFSV
jgi:hypothetical protein